ncbi:hypothetical protein K9M47_04150 [Candidatus Gracilibacteria bacterium]|nr:hypothetical protein [Candidatus Gracilibacteria bacterium]
MSHKAISPLIILSLLIIQVNVVSACSPAPGAWPPLKSEATGLIIKTNSLGPVYTNLSEYTVIFSDYSSDISCGPNKIYAKTPLAIMIFILVGYILGVVVTTGFRNKTVPSKV